MKRYKPLFEKWAGDIRLDPAERGKYEGVSLSELKSMLQKLKASGPHPKGSPDYEKQNEIEFAIRAKTGWGSVS